MQQPQYQHQRPAPQYMPVNVTAESGPHHRPHWWTPLQPQIGFSAAAFASAMRRHVCTNFWSQPSPLSPSLFRPSSASVQVRMPTGDTAL